MQSQMNYVQREQAPAGLSGTSWVQWALNRVLGLRLAVDGIAGPQTRTAIRDFQAAEGLSVDGIAGPATLAALEVALAAPAGDAPSSYPGSGTPPPSSPSRRGRGSAVVTVSSNARVSDNAVRILEELLADAGLESGTITSGRRTTADQARIMYDLIRREGVVYARNLYGSSGDKVIDVYVETSQRLSPDEVKAAMQRKIVEVGPTNVSHHTSDEFDVIDVAPSSIANQPAFEAALHAALEDKRIDKVIFPPGDPAYHIEVRLVG